MRTLVTIGPVFQHELPPGVFDRLLSILPEGRYGSQGHSFRAELVADDRRVAAILQVVSDAGFRPWTDRSREPNSKVFDLRYEREYAPVDLEAFQWLELYPDVIHPKALFRDPTGLVILPRQAFPRKATMFRGGAFQWWIVSDRVRRDLEAEGFDGLVFRATIVPGSKPGATPEFWELDSVHTMPKLSSSMTFFNSKGHPVENGNFDGGFHRREGLFYRAELHYRASDVAQLRGIDLARTYEPFGNRKEYDRLDCPLVASNRFYRWCRGKKLTVGWIPVRVDQD